MKVAQLAETFGMSDATIYDWLAAPGAFGSRDVGASDASCLGGAYASVLFVQGGS